MILDADWELGLTGTIYSNTIHILVSMKENLVLCTAGFVQWALEVCFNHLICSQAMNVDDVCEFDQPRRIIKTLHPNATLFLVMLRHHSLDK